MRSQLVIYPKMDTNYASYLISGLRHAAGDAAMVLDVAGFPREGFGQRRPFAVRLVTSGGREVRVYYDSDDMTPVDHMALRWADVYLKTNLLPDDPVSQDPRIVLTGPTFGCRIEPLRLAARLHLTGQRSAASIHEISSRLRALRSNTRRQPIHAYGPCASRVEDDYVFFAAWPWAKHEEVNPPRASFIAACRSVPDIRFEGGFVPRRRLDPIADRELMASQRYGHRTYLDRIARSTVVFSNPAVHGCLGWKLGEFLAMGKAIISTPLNRALPAPLEHGKHIHFVEDADDDAMREAITRVVGDPAYRRVLEAGARDYFDRHVAPDVLVGQVESRVGAPIF